MRTSIKMAAAAALGLIGLAVTATSASADIVCNREGDCWHVKPHYVYRPEFGIVVHPNGWRWRAGEHYRWREHPGRGYWRNGVWIRF
ncbi:MAG TPA: hypothetical protein VHC42_10560 [Rhizomicrobium sp.]|jgi:hypothetical protein|nr:hypothetical protein [Rhizomicrobium sp.]